jgi:predicted phage terminase large subunit-like protein
LSCCRRAQPVAAAWNQKRILLPEGAPWLSEFLSEVCGFTGVKDRHDDIVDALAAAYDALQGGPAEVGATVIG